MFWYFEDVPRFKSERQGISALAASQSWLRVRPWRFDKQLHATCDLDIVVKDRVFEASLQYPTTFPHSPPIVLPRDEKSRWSRHQFGAGGELCLEFGPDNWTPDMSGAQIVESAYKLLAGEMPPEPGAQPPIVPSRHVNSLGRDTRDAFGRLVLTQALSSAITELPVGGTATGEIVYVYPVDTVVYLMKNLTFADGSVVNFKIPPKLSPFTRPTFVMRLAAGASFPDPSKTEDFLAAIRQFEPVEGSAVIILVRDAEVRCYFVIDGQTVVKYAVLAEPDGQTRRSSDSTKLADKSVAIIGNGSMGSKLAIMLARSGVGTFFLCDEDVLFSGNIVRNEFDWREVGQHKANALEARLKLINPSVQVSKLRVKIGGQEASSDLDAALKATSECDLVIDATADPRCFNILSGLVETYKKPFVYAEVFGGGIGGLMMRYRPSIDLPPQYARRAIENWFEQKGCKPEPPRRNYETGDLENPLTADDADVSVIAAHAARFALDILLERDPSHYPESAYAIGLAPGLVFEQPFQTWPISIANTLPPSPKPTLSNDEQQAELKNIVQMLSDSVTQ